VIRVGIAGCGFIGTIHSFTLKALIEAEVVDAAVTSVYDPDHDRAIRFARVHGAAVAAGPDELLDGVDAVWICTWTAAHLAWVQAAAQKGIAVFCEKPLAPTLRDAEAVAAAAMPVRHQVGLVLRHAPVFTTLAGLIADGRYGRPMVAILRDDQYFPTQGQYGSTWRADVATAGGGTLVEHSIHDVDVLAWVLGPITAASGATSSFAGHEGIEDVAVARFEHAGGAHSSVVSIWHQVLTRPSTRRLEIFCENALLWTEDDYLGPLTIQTSAGTETVTATEPAWLAALRFPAGTERALRQYAVPNRAFLDGLRDAAPVPGYPSVDDALAAHRAVDAVYRSAAQAGARVAVEARI